MKDDRNRIPVESEYLRAIGMSVYAFSRLEWDVVWCCERLEKNWIYTVGTLTAGQIANKFSDLADAYPDEDQRKDFQQNADWFKKLVKVRNSIMHANPATDKKDNDAQRLFRNGVAWTIPMLNDVADEYTECAGRFNAYLYGVLKDPA